MDAFVGVIMEDYSSEYEKQWIRFALNQSQASGSGYLQGQALCQLCSKSSLPGKRIQVLHQLQLEPLLF